MDAAPYRYALKGIMTMTEDPQLETQSAEARAEWVKPEVRRMAAGDAEAGFGGGAEDVPYSNS